MADYWPISTRFSAFLSQGISRSKLEPYTKVACCDRSKCELTTDVDGYIKKKNKLIILGKIYVICP